MKVPLLSIFEEPAASFGIGNGGQDVKKEGEVNELLLGSQKNLWREKQTGFKDQEAGQLKVFLILLESIQISLFMIIRLLNIRPVDK